MRQLKTLLLSRNYMPLAIEPLSTAVAKDAITNVLNGTCTMIYGYDGPIGTPSRNDLLWPSVVVTNTEFKFNRAKYSRGSLYYRDHACCAYCDDPISMREMTIDHVVPMKLGGKGGWDNTVSACKECNKKKSDKPPKGIWKPKKQPFTPTYFQIAEARAKHPITIPDRRWLEFLPHWVGDVHVVPPERFVCEETAEEA